MARWRTIRRDHQRAFDVRFPMLPEVKIEHTWRGYVCLSRNHAPGFGKVGPHTFAAVCQNGVGVTKGTISGVLAADMATGQDNPLIADLEEQGKPDPAAAGAAHLPRRPRPPRPRQHPLAAASVRALSDLHGPRQSPDEIQGRTVKGFSQPAGSRGAPP